MRLILNERQYCDWLAGQDQVVTAQNRMRRNEANRYPTYLTNCQHGDAYEPLDSQPPAPPLSSICCIVPTSSLSAAVIGLSGHEDVIKAMYKRYRRYQNPVQNALKLSKPIIALCNGGAAKALLCSFSVSSSRGPRPFVLIQLSTSFVYSRGCDIATSEWRNSNHLAPR